MDIFRNKHFSQLRQRLDQRGRTLGGSRWRIFGPGMFFILLGLITVLAPGLILAVIATFFVFVGLLLCFLAWKFIHLKRSLEDAAKKFEGSIHVQRVNFGQPLFDEPEEVEDDEDTIIIH